MIGDLDHLLAEEERRVCALRRAVDVRLVWIRAGALTRIEAESLTAQAREIALRLFPGKGEVFELVYAPRFRRAITERFGAATEPT
jgi:hypothetical protein